MLHDMPIKLLRFRELVGALYNLLCGEMWLHDPCQVITHTARGQNKNDNNNNKVYNYHQQIVHANTLLCYSNDDGKE